MTNSIIHTTFACVLMLAHGITFADDASQIANAQHIQVLAGSCAACHGTQGNALAGNAVLAGFNQELFITKLNDFKSGKQASTVMHHHAKGLTDLEIQSLATYFSGLTAKPASSPKHSQKSEN